jgi:chitinase
MSYDLVSGFSKQTGHHTTLYSNASQKQSTDNGVQLLLQKGVPPQKIVIGAAFYARTWKDVPDIQNGLYQPGEFQSFVPYKNGINSLDSTNGFTTYYDEIAQSYWKYNKEKKVFATFDNGSTVRGKIKYVKRMKLRGIMFWELSLDLPQYGLLQAITDEISLHSF